MSHPFEAPHEWSRRDALRLGLLGVGGMALGSSLVACSSSSGSAGPSGGATTFSPGTFTGGPAATGTPVTGGTLTVGVLSNGKSETLSVPGTLNIPDFARVLNLYDTMFRQAPNGTVTPGVVETAEANADATVWTFKIRQGVTFHDGRPLTADDIVYTIQNSWGSKDNLFNGALAQAVDFANVTKTGQFEVRVPLNFGIAKFPTIACFVNCAVVQDGTKDFTKGNGTGPFKLVSFDPGKRSEFAANKDYWGDDGPYVDTLVIDSSFGSEDARMNALLAGQIDISPAPSFTLAKAHAVSGRIVVGNQPGPGTTPLIMRVDQGPLSDPDLRRALKLLPDRPKYLDAAFNGFGTVGNDLQGYTNQYFADSLKATHDPEQAKAILAKAGLANVSLTLDSSAAVPGMQETAALFAQDAKAAGINIKINTIDPATFFTAAAAVFERPFAVSFYSIGLNSLPLYYMAAGIPGGIYNECHFGTPAQVETIKKAMREQDDTKATQLWLDVQKDQVDLGGYIVPANFNYVDAYGLNVRGIQTTSTMNCDNFNFKTAWIEKG